MTRIREGETVIIWNPGAVSVEVKEKMGTDETGCTPSGAKYRIKSSAADHKNPAVPALKMSISEARSVISFHFHANGLNRMHTLKSTEAHTFVYNKNITPADACTNTHFQTCPEVLQRNGKHELESHHRK